MIPISIIVTPLLLVFIISMFTPALNVFFVKLLFEASEYAAPENIESIRNEVNVIKDINYGDETLDIYFPRDSNGILPAIMWIHGGGFVSDSKEDTKDYGMILANEGYVVANINYTIAPTKAYPTPIIQANQALKYLQENVVKYHGDHMGKVFIGGDSAGAQIASQVSAIITNDELAKAMDINPAIDKEQLKGALLYCGLYDMDLMVGSEKEPSAFLKYFKQSTFLAYTGVKDFGTFEKIDEMSTVKP
ncbi:alpha/beta hydrolase [Peribacillus butanolivorans]|uniref:alpha/beta hydrolase n=1 Tax=Peribacillus butanolivorans TaxID=421767 RepID=UPI0036809FB2